MRQERSKKLYSILLWISVAAFSLAWGLTTVAADENVRLTGLSISGPSQVNESSTAAYTATALFSDGTKRALTSGVSWSENSSYAGISSSGVLTTQAVNSNQSVSVTARYSSKGTSRTGTKAVTIVNGGSSTQATLSGLTVSGPASVAGNSATPYTATANYSDGTSRDVTATSSWSENSSFASISSAGVLSTTAVTSNQSVTVNASFAVGGITRTASRAVIISAAAPPQPPSNSAKSINSTSQNRASLPSVAVPEQTFVTLSGFQILSVNDLGMHCGDLDHRVASILPPFNVLHAMVIQKGTSSVNPEILTSADVDVLYSAASNPNDPALQIPAPTSIFKTNFWDKIAGQASGSVALEAYDPFYPPGILSQFPLTADTGLPVPDVAELYPVTGTGALVASQQQMPGATVPFSGNTPQSFKRFDTDLPFFVNFQFGYRLANMNWFAADGIPIAPFDDLGRKNPYPLMRVQAKSKNNTLTGKTGDVLASIDAVLPVSAEADCFRCHASSADGGGGFAACIPGIDANCPQLGSPRSGTAFPVVRATEDTSTAPADAKREWAADNNIIRLHDAKHGTHLQASTPVVCQTCHYTPALDLAHFGPVGPDGADANGREQKIHKSNSRVMHEFHSRFTDLFQNDMPAPTDTRRIDPATGKPVVNAFVVNKLNQSCYQCHPGQNTKCLRGAMFNGGLICQDCHGGMQQVGNDFSKNFSVATPFPSGADLTLRVPWANVPKCQSCHTGDAVNNLGLNDPNVVRSADGIRLLQAWHTNDTQKAAPITATNKRFAENESGANTVLYRFSKGHSGVSCQSCHGSTHAEWPVMPESGTYVANDNVEAIELQGHTGKIMECTACHTAGSLPVSLGGPHGLHPVGDQRFADGGHESLAERNRNDCRACHGQTGGGSVLSKVAVNRTVSVEGRTVTLTKGQMVTCNLCHSNKL